jgi:hypothetical protein
MRNKKSVLMTLNHNYGYFSGVGSGIAGNVWCFASVVPIHKLLSAQLSKTLDNRCFYIN